MQSLGQQCGPDQTLGGLLGQAVLHRLVAPGSDRAAEKWKFARRGNRFTGLELVSFDSTSMYFGGDGGQTVGPYGRSKDHRPDRLERVGGSAG